MSRKNSGISVVDLSRTGQQKEDLDASGIDQSDPDDKSDEEEIQVMLSDDEEEAKRRSEKTYHLQFVQCMSVLVKCCCSLIADLPTFRQAAEDVTVKVSEFLSFAQF